VGAKRAYVKYQKNEIVKNCQFNSFRHFKFIVQIIVQFIVLVLEYY
jgi:hypothetical protein